MSRLNGSIRNLIIHNALKASGVISRNDKLVSRRSSLANDVRLFAIGGLEAESKAMAQFEKIKKSISKLDSNLFRNSSSCYPREDCSISVNFSGMASVLRFNGVVKGDSNGTEDVYKKMVAYNRVNITKDNPLYDEFISIEAESDIVKNLRVQVTSEVNAMVNSVTTIKKPLELWPEAKELLPKEEKSKATTLVADVSKLNTMIGLPK